MDDLTMNGAGLLLAACYDLKHQLMVKPLESRRRIAAKAGVNFGSLQYCATGGG
jgi:hypothetical protein